MLRNATLRALVLPAAGLAWLGLAGCASGPLTVDFHVVGRAQSLSYHLDPDGRLAVSAGDGSATGASSGALYQARLSDEAMARLKQVVLKSGFLLAEPPYRAPLAPGIMMLVKIELGLWRNRMDTRGARVESVSRIVAEMNRHLPPQYALPDTAGSAEREEQEIQKYLKEMSQP